MTAHVSYGSHQVAAQSSTSAYLTSCHVCQLKAGMTVQERPVEKAIRPDRAQGQAGKQVYGVRLGAGDRSYLVRDKQIEVLKNTYGGVKVHMSNSMPCYPFLSLLASRPETLPSSMLMSQCMGKLQLAMSFHHIIPQLQTPFLLVHCRQAVIEQWQKCHDALTLVLGCRAQA